MTEHLAHALRMASTIACGIVVVAFVLWASDEGRAQTDRQVAKAGMLDPNQMAGHPAAEHGGLRGAIADAGDVLIAPFEGVAAAEGPWVAHAIPALLALLVYGLLARLLINYIPARR